MINTTTNLQMASRVLDVLPDSEEFHEEEALFDRPLVFPWWSFRKSG